MCASTLRRAALRHSPMRLPTKPGKHLDAAGAGRTGQANALRGEIAGHVHRAGIAVIARHPQLGDEMQPLPVGVHAKRRFGSLLASFVFLRLLAVDGQANADGRVEHAVTESKPLGLTSTDSCLPP